MFHVLLVDDEENVLKILKTTIEWNALGVESIVTAQDGQQALSILKKQKIDLLITDIKMPRFDGINLIRQAKQIYPDIRCILLTAYGEFEYAREAIILGVENYLLKPVVKEEVEQTIQKALDNLYARQKNGEGLLRENILRRWVSGMITGEELSERALMLGLNLYLPEYSVICMVKKGEEFPQGFRMSCVSLLTEQLEVYPFWDEKGRFILIIGGKQLDIGNLERQLLELAQRAGVEDAIGIAFGASVSNPDFLHISYQVVCECVELSNLNQSGVILRNDYQLGDYEKNWLVEEIRFLFFCQEERIRNTGFRHLTYKLQKRIRDGETDDIIVFLLGSCVKVLVTEFPLQENLQQLMYERKWECVRNQSEEAFTDEVFQIFSYAYHIFENCYNRYSPIVQLAMKYAQNGALEGSLGSLKEFCSLNGMNQAYLGHIFKKETGYFFNDYQMQCCINRSLILLKNPNYKIKDIAEKVGFGSVSYFVKCFGKYKGVSPSKYRMSMEEG